MSNDKVFASIIIALLAASFASSFTAAYLYRLSLEQSRQATDLDSEIGQLGRDFFTSSNETIDLDYVISLLNPENSTAPNGSP